MNLPSFRREQPTPPCPDCDRVIASNGPRFSAIICPKSGGPGAADTAPDRGQHLVGGAVMADPIPVERVPVTQMESWWQRIERLPSGCWEWTGHRNPAGYGLFNVRGYKADRLAHRWGYQTLVGPVEPWLHLDHLCRNRACVNPSHLEPVEPRENYRRGLRGVLATHCKHGHPWDDVNTYKRPGGNARQCRACMRIDRQRRPKKPQR